MSSQDDIATAESDGRRNRALYRACSGGLALAVTRSGGELSGLSIKTSGYDCLVTLRARFPAGPMVAFVGGETIAHCLVKAMREAPNGALRWKVDRYAKNQA